MDQISDETVEFKPNYLRKGCKKNEASSKADTRTDVSPRLPIHRDVICPE